MLGALLPIGGYKGANIALMVEMLAAGLSGASWSLDAGNFRSGCRPPRVRLTVIARLPDVADPDFVNRTGEYLRQLAGSSVHVPGSAVRSETMDDSEIVGIEAGMPTAIRSFAG